MAYKIQGGSITKNKVLLEADENGVTLFATDLKTSIRKSVFGVSSDSPGRVVFPADRLNTLVFKCSGDAMEISVDEDKATVRAGKSRYKLTLPNPEDFPRFQGGRESSPWCELSREELISAAENGSIAGSDGQEYPAYLGAVLFRRSPENDLQIASTDIKRIAIATAAADFPEYAQADLMIPTRAARRISDILKSSDSERVQVRFSDSHAYFLAGDDLEFSSGRIDTQFPDFAPLVLRGAIRDEEETFNPQEFRKCLERLYDLVKNEIGTTLLLGGEAAGFSQGGIALERYSAEISGRPILPRMYNARFLLEGLKLFLGTESLTAHYHTGSGQMTMRAGSLTYLVMPIDAPQDQIAGYVRQVKEFEDGGGMA
jgi:DNA polymerase-3 subunit beta